MTSTPAWISLGSNLGDRRAILDAAVVSLGQTPGITVSAVSSYRETRPVGGPPGQGPFLNAAARLDTMLGPRELLGVIQRIEAEMGRVRVVRWGERTLDLDILMFGSKYVDEPDLKLPHPRLAVRRFVLEPLAEIAADLVDTITRRTVADLLANLVRTPRVLMWVDPGSPTLAGRVAETLAVPLICGPAVGPSDFPMGYTNSSMRLMLEVLALGAAMTDHTGESSRWLVCDFAFDRPRLFKQLSPTPNQFQTKRKWASWFGSAPRQWINHLTFDLLSTIADGTLVIASPRGRPARRPQSFRTPVYWPQAVAPDAIVAEVVAVCRGIEAV